jgi:CRP/FNR family transcriptional regulator
MKCCRHCESEASCIDHVPIFAGLSREEKLEIAGIAASRSLEKGGMIYRAGDEGGTLFVLYTGRAKIFRLGQGGKEQVLRIAGPGEFIGELSLFSSLPLTDFAQALEATTMCVLQGDRLKDLMRKYPSIAFKVMDELSRRLEKAERRIKEISLNPVNSRVAAALLELSGGGGDFSLPMTKGDLASHLGISQETLSRRLAALQEEGFIALEGHRKIYIKNRPGLEGISSGE